MIDQLALKMVVPKLSLQLAWIYNHIGVISSMIMDGKEFAALPHCETLCSL